MRSSAFSHYMRVVLNHAMLALSISLGRRTGLLETLARLPPSTSARIAGEAGLDERYVREWLGAMVTGRIVDYDGVHGTYALPAEHAAVLTEAAGADDMALAMQSVPALARVEPRVAACFRSGRGLPPETFGEWRTLRAQEIARRHQAILLEEILPLAPGLMDRLRAGIEVLDLSPDGHHSRRLLEAAFANSHFAAEALAGPVGTRGETFDLVTAFDCVHEHPQPAQLLAAVHAALRPGGTFLCMEMAGSSNLADNVEHPLGPLVYTVSTFQSLPASHGVGPGAMWGEEQARRMITSAGLRDVVARRVEKDADHVYYLATKPS